MAKPIADASVCTRCEGGTPTPGAAEVLCLFCAGELALPIPAFPTPLPEKSKL